MGKNREQKKKKKWNKKSSAKDVLNSKYIRNKVKIIEKRQTKQLNNPPRNSK